MDNKRSRAVTEPLPPHSEWWFRQIRKRVAIGYIRKHAHALRLARSSAVLPADDRPRLVVMNHPSWWDPLIAYALSSLMPQHRHYGVMDADALRKYPILRKAGMLGIELNSFRGAANFLKLGQGILSHPRTAFWVTAQGEFADVRRRPLALRSGVGHLAAKLGDGWIIPIGLEVTFWNERTPELLARVGEPISLPTSTNTAAAVLEQIENRLTMTLDALAEDAISRDANRFETLVSGRTGIGGVYDWWRRLKATLRGESFDPRHDTGDRSR